MQVDTSIWGVPYSEYDSMNNRTGAADLDDADFTDYPPFVKNDMRTNGISNGFLSNETLYIGYLNNPSQFDFMKPMDFSIAYCACKNPDLGLNNIGIPIPSQYDPYQSDISPANAFRFKTKPNKPQPIAFLNSYGFMHDLTTTVSVGQFSNPYYMQSVLLSAQTKYVPNGNNNNGNTDTQAHINSSNRNLFFSYWRDFGLRCLFGTIMITYFDGTYNATTGVPQNVATKSLYWFESQTDEFKNSHRILGAFLRVNFRRSTTGLYNSTTPQNQCFVADFSGNLFADENIWGNQYPLQQWQPCSAYVRNTGSYLPLFGPANLGQTINTRTGYVSWVSQQSTGGTSQYSGLLLGINTELSFLSYGHGLATNDTGRRSYWIEMDYTSESAEYIRKCAAAYGLFFTDGESTDTGYSELYAAGHDDDRWTNSNMCLGVVDDEGYTDGTYTRGTGNEGANNWGWKTASQSPYDPSRPPPTPTMSYDTTTTFNDISNIATLTRRYALTKQNVEDLGSELWQISSDIINNIQNDEWYKYTADVMDTFLVTDPLSCIVSLQKYPLTIPEQSGPVNIKLGKAETSISANITKATAKTYYFTPVPIRPRFGNSFMDYEPYTHFELYVPFCGTTELDPRDILGRTLSVNLVVDFNTGTCVAYVRSDSLVIETINGSLAIDIPVTGVDSTTIASNITQGIINTRNARYTHQFGTLGKFASPSGIVSNVSNVWGSAQSILTSENNAKLSEYELTHQPAQPHVIGSASPVGSWAIDFKCRLLIYYPTGGIVDESKVADSSQPTAFDSAVFEQYQTQIGFATVDPVSSLGASYAHTLVCAEKAILNNITTPNGRPATEPELQLIRQALQEGVILP